MVNKNTVKEIFLHARHKQNMAIMVMASNSSMESSVKSTKSSNNERCATHKLTYRLID